MEKKDITIDVLMILLFLLTIAAAFVLVDRRDKYEEEIEGLRFRNKVLEVSLQECREK